MSEDESQRPSLVQKVLLFSTDPAYREEFAEAVAQKAEGAPVLLPRTLDEAIALVQKERPTVALVHLGTSAAPLVLERLRAEDPDLEVVWAPPPSSVSHGIHLLKDAVARADKRHEPLLAAHELIAEMSRERARLRASLAEKQHKPQTPQPTRGLTSGALGPLERLAGVLAHELNNPLTFVLSNLTCIRQLAQTLQEQLTTLPNQGISDIRATWEEIAEVLSEVETGANRVREVVSDLTTLGTRAGAEGTRRPVVLEEVVRAALRIAKREVERRAQVDLDLEKGLPRVPGSPSRLGQVILNLLLNAVQALPPGEPDSHRISIHARAEGGRVVLRISDTGSGIEPDSLSRVFEPGYTTKPIGQGSGLGLAISREIVRMHGGEIRIESQPGWGTTVTVSLPVWPEEGAMEARA